MCACVHACVRVYVCVCVCVYLRAHAPVRTCMFMLTVCIQDLAARNVMLDSNKVCKVSTCLDVDCSSDYCLPGTICCHRGILTVMLFHCIPL